MSIRSSMARGIVGFLLVIQVGCTDDETVTDRGDVDAVMVELVGSGDTEFDIDIAIGVEGRPDGGGPRDVAQAIGRALGERDGAGDSLWPDPSNFMQQIADEGLPSEVYGPDSIELLGSADTFFGGLESSESYELLSEDQQERANEVLLSAGAIVALGGPVGEQIAGIGTDAGDAVSFFEALVGDPGSNASQYVSEFQAIIVGNSQL